MAVAKVLAMATAPWGVDRNDDSGSRAPKNAGHMKSKSATVFMIMAMCLAGSASAHHSFAAFDGSRVVPLKGTVKEFQWTNPHCWLQLEVVGPDGKVQEWALEGLSPNVLSRMGWKRNSVGHGDVVTVYINPLKDGGHGGNMVKILRSDGSQVGSAP